MAEGAVLDGRLMGDSVLPVAAYFVVAGEAEDWFSFGMKVGVWRAMGGMAGSTIQLGNRCVRNLLAA